MNGNREYKSDVFSLLMQDPRNALEVYNAVNNTDYKDPAIVEICTLEKGISLSVRNDASFIVDMNLNLYEHQSTICPNMPLRNLFYINDVLKKIISRDNIFGQKLLKIPTPHFVVFYNGSREQPECYEMKLSDAFENKAENPQLELKCTVYNINYGKNKQMMEKCSVISEYSLFIDYTRYYYEQNNFTDLEYALEQAIDRCIKENVLREFLKKNRTEVMKVMQLDYTFERQLELERADALEEGEAKGKLLKIINQLCRKLLKNKPLEQIADELEEDITFVEPLYDIAVKYAPDYDVEKIYEEYVSKTQT